MKRYLTTTLPYVNANPHLGHALEFVEADFLARTLRARGDEIFLHTGTDEHGAKIAKNAEEAGRSPQEYVDDYAARFRAFADRLDMSYDAFSRTSSPEHTKVAQEFWRRCLANGNIYKAEYEIKYCIGCELEKTDHELVDGRCPIHPNLEIEIRKEENYYFTFSKFQDALLDLYKNNPAFVIPKERLGEIESFVKQGLKDFSISRKKEKLSWGVPVPDDDEHVMYVWFDALVSYLSAFGWPEGDTEWWPVTHMAGKDNLRQQAAMWQAMLLSVGLPTSGQVFIHGFITSGGVKMSKSLGNVIDPVALADTYGVEALRYVLLRHVNPFEDSDLTEAAVREYYTANLTNGLGNLVARVMKLAEEHLPQPVALTAQDTEIEGVFFDLVEAYKFNSAMDLIWEHVGKADAYITEHEPYKKVKSDDESVKAEGLADIEKLVRHIAKVAVHLAPAMPHTAELILKAVKENKKPENLFPRLP